MATGTGLGRGHQYAVAIPITANSPKRPQKAHRFADRGDEPSLTMTGALGVSNSTVPFDSTVARDDRNGDSRCEWPPKVGNVGQSRNGASHGVDCRGSRCEVPR